MAVKWGNTPCPYVEANWEKNYCLAIINTIKNINLRD